METVQQKVPLKYQKDEIWLGNGRWSREDNLQIVKRIHRWKVKKINAQNNQRFKLIKDIVNIDFPNLISLNIPNNHITSIEELIFVNMPNIQHLSLYKNRIRSLRVLRKVHRHSLLSFSTQTNFICDIGTLTQAFLPKVKSLSVYWHDKYEGNSVDQVFDPFSLVKLKLQSLEAFGMIVSKKRDGFKEVFHKSII